MLLKRLNDAQGSFFPGASSSQTRFPGGEGCCCSTRQRIPLSSVYISLQWYLWSCFGLQLRDIFLIICPFRSSKIDIFFLYYLLVLYGKMSTFLIQLPKVFLVSERQDNDPFMRGEEVSQAFPNLPLFHCAWITWQKGLQSWLWRWFTKLRSWRDWELIYSHEVSNGSYLVEVH